MSLIWQRIGRSATTNPWLKSATGPNVTNAPRVASNEAI